MSVGRLQLVEKTFRGSEAAYRRERPMGFVQRLVSKFVSLFVHHLPSWRMRGPLYRVMGVKLAPDSFVGRESYLDPEFPELITIEDGVTLSARVIVACHDSSRDLVAPVRICAGAFIGTGAIILPGVTIGRRAVIGAGTVVSHDVEPSQVWVGSPARTIGMRKPIDGQCQ